MAHCGVAERDVGIVVRGAGIDDEEEVPIYVLKHKAGEAKHDGLLLVVRGRRDYYVDIPGQRASVVGDSGPYQRVRVE